jgi:hypothetical protein
MAWQDAGVIRARTKLLRILIWIFCSGVFAVTLLWPESFVAHAVFDFLRFLLGLAILAVLYWQRQHLFLCLALLIGMAIFPVFFFCLGLWLILYGDVLAGRVK